ncbi:MAG: hypothetical protein ACRDHK_10620 [Actinomycetota bacterium]
MHKKDSPIGLLTEAGELVERRIRTEPQRFAEVRGWRPRARILIEASTPPSVTSWPDDHHFSALVSGGGWGDFDSHRWGVFGAAGFMTATPNFAPAFSRRYRRSRR